jgi:hypothetical protein
LQKNHLVGLGGLKASGRIFGLLGHVAGQNGVGGGELLLTALKLTEAIRGLIQLAIYINGGAISHQGEAD